MELSPFFVVNSLLVHIIVLSFLLTLPVYSNENEKKSLWGYFVYLRGEEEMKAKASPEIDALKEQAAAQKSMEPEMIYRNNAGKNNKKEEIAPSEETVKVQENEDVLGENMGDKNHLELKQNESDTVTEVMDGAFVSDEPLDIEKGLDKEIVKKDDPEAPQQAATSEKAVLNENRAIYSDQVQENLSEKKADTQDEKTAPVVFTPLTEGPRKSDILIDGAEAVAQYDNPPEKEDNMALEKKDLVEKDNGVKPEKPSLGLPLDGPLFLKDIKIEVLVRDGEDSGVFIYLLKNPYLSLRKRHTWGKEKKVRISEESGILTDATKEKKKIFSVAKAGEGVYTFVMDNRVAAPYNTGVLFLLYGGQKHERRKEIKSVSVPPSSMARFMFVLPEAVFWDDEDFFTGSIEDSDSITKFNDETGFSWREEKEF